MNGFPGAFPPGLGMPFGGPMPGFGGPGISPMAPFGAYPGFGTGGNPYFPGAPGVPPMVNPSLNYL